MKLLTSTVEVAAAVVAVEAGLNSWPIFLEGLKLFGPDRLRVSRQTVGGRWLWDEEVSTMELFSRKGRRLLSAQWSDKFGYFPHELSILFCNFINTSADRGLQQLVLLKISMF